MRRIKHIINSLIWTVVGLYLATAILVHIPAVQAFIGSEVSSALSQKLGTKVMVGRVDVGFLNRIIIDDVLAFDQNKKEMLKAIRVSAKLDYLALMKGRVIVTSAQLFGLHANLYQETAEAKPNFQFVLDSLASKDTTTRSKPLDLEISSLIIRNGQISYDRLDQPKKPNFDPNHISVHNLSSHIILNKFSGDSINLNIKKLAFVERSRLDVESLSFKFIANEKQAELTNFCLQLPHTDLQFENITATYRLTDNKIELPTLAYSGGIKESSVTPSDIACLVPVLKDYSRPVVVRAVVSGTSTGIRVKELDISVPKEKRSNVLSAPSNIRLTADGSISSWNSTPRWAATVTNLTVDEEGLELLAGNIPEFIGRMGNLNYKGRVGGYGTAFTTNGILHAGAGDAKLAFGLHDGDVFGKLDTEGFNLAQILDDNKFGMLASHISVEGNIKKSYYKAQGNVSRFDYNDYSYRNINIDGALSKGEFNGKFNIDDPNIIAALNGYVNTNKKSSSANFTATIEKFSPSVLHWWQGKYATADYSAEIIANFTGNNINTANGSLEVNNFSMTSAEDNYHLDSLRLEAGANKEGHTLTMHSDFGYAEVTGEFDYTTLTQSVKNVIVSKLPSIQHLTPAIKYRKSTSNNFTVNATIVKADWMHYLLGMDVELPEPLTLEGGMNNQTSDLHLDFSAPNVIYNGTHYKFAKAVVTSPNDQLNADISITQMRANGLTSDYRVEAVAKDDRLTSVISLDNHARTQRLQGKLNSVVDFSTNRFGKTEAHVLIKESNISIGDTILTIHPSEITYSKNRLAIDHFTIANGSQHVIIDGVAQKGTDDILTVDLDDVNITYVQDLLNFHPVDFGGLLSGKAYVYHLFDKPNATGSFTAKRFTFMNGRMGTLHADVNWNPDQGKINIDAQTIEEYENNRSEIALRRTFINGYVSPTQNNIDLTIKADNTRGEFLETLCSSFIHNTNLTANGNLHVWGDLKAINLTGEIIADGTLTITPLNTRYTLKKDAIRFLVDEIRFPNDTIYDRNGNAGIVTGSVYHQNLSKMTYDIDVKAKNLLCYNFDGSDGSLFYGTVYGTGNASVKGKSGEVTIDVNLTPERGSQVVYDVSSPEAVGTQEFIHWSSRDFVSADTLTIYSPFANLERRDGDRNAREIPTDIRINFIINTTPAATLKLIMDKTSGDYITLNGSGALRADFYNKGGLNIYGNYVVDHGVYKMTIQNVIKRDFQFTQGGTIAFGGDPYSANLNLRAQYQVNSVSLSDLQIGRSFSSNSIRVNCLMNIGGTPSAPKIDFDLDMPTVGNDAKQMIYSIINSEEEMNQQVLYLLAVGRFYSQGSNNASVDGTGGSRTSLAMQSILSGQISQQLNNILGTVVNNTNWNFGANISTGDEGWNNAEYEGMLSGRLLNNRLLFDGQFGYRDNANATTSFIGDFDLRYLITPNGTLSAHVYNQTNDRYFTRNSLNTQGLGFIIKRDFNGLRDLFGLKKKRKDKKESESGSTPTLPVKQDAATGDSTLIGTYQQK